MPTDAREYAKHVPGAIWLDGVPWHLYGRVLMPLTMPHVPLEVDRTVLRRAMTEKKALLASWTSDWDSLADSEWWWVACDLPNYDVDLLASSAGRQSTRKGLRHCSVDRLELTEFCGLSYPLLRSAVERYGEPPPGETEWKTGIEQLARYPGAEFWGAFCDNRLAAYAICLVIDGAVDISSAKSDPELHKHEPNAALFYTLSKHYLDGGMRYVTNGTRTLSHPTTINTFLEKLGYRKVPCRVNVELSLAAKAVDAVHLARWGRSVGLPRFLGSRWSQLESFNKLLTIAKTFDLNS